MGSPGRVFLLLVSAMLAGGAHADEATATYLANEGVLIARADTKILFDPLFDPYRPIGCQVVLTSWVSLIR